MGSTVKRALVLAPALMFLLAPGEPSAQPAPRKGGTLKVATVGEPPTLDIQKSTTVLTYEIMWHVFESLFTYDPAFNPIPLLAEAHEVGDRGIRHTITLRRGVRFHNGKEMTAADVVASIKRWGQVATLGQHLWKSVEAAEARDTYTVVLTLKQPSASLVYGLAEPAAMIYPREVIEAAGDGTIRQFIGTGPFRFVEHKPDRHIKVARFDDYVARGEPPNGFGGSRIAWLDEILFIPVPDAVVRLAGVTAGDFDYAAWPSDRTPSSGSGVSLRSSPASSSRAVGP